MINIVDLTERALGIIESTVDRGVGFVSPRTALDRRLARHHINQFRQYAAAKTTRLTGDWIPVNQDVNSIIRSSSNILRGRTRQLVRDFPYFNRAINNLVNYSVGTGIRFQSRVRTSDGKYDKKAIRQIEDAVSWAMDEMDVSGKLHYTELERLAKRQDVESGEYLFVKTYLSDAKRYIPYSLQAYEADWLTSSHSIVRSGNEVDQGIEYNKKTGQVVAYHFAVPSGYSPNSLTASTQTTRIPAEDVIHNFQTLRPGQLRGVSPFTSAILIAHDLGDYIDAEIDGAKMAAKYLAMIETPDPATFQNLRGTTDPNSGKKIEELENSIIEYLRPGEKVNLASHNRPGEAFPEFTKFCLRMVAISTDTTYELLTSDYEGINYSNLRGIRNDYAVMIRPHSMRQTLHFSKPVMHDIITQAVLAGKIDLPGFWRNPHHYFRGTYTPPGMESIDPLREGKAWVEQINARIRSPQEIAAARGRDIEEIVDEIAEFYAMLDKRGLKVEKTSTALKQNPDALGATENNKTTEGEKTTEEVSHAALQ